MNIISRNFALIIILVLIGIIFLQRACQPEIPTKEGYIKIGSKEYKVLVDSIKVSYINSIDSTPVYTPDVGKVIGTTKPETSKPNLNNNNSTTSRPTGTKTVGTTKPEISKPSQPNTGIDTNDVVEDYYRKYQYDDVLNISQFATVGDSTEVELKGRIFLKDVVSRNKIMERSFTTDFKIPVVERLTIVEAPAKTKVYIGGNLGFDQTNIINQASAGILLQTKKDNIYSLQFGASNTTTDLLNANTKILPFVGFGAYWKIKLRGK